MDVAIGSAPHPALSSFATVAELVEALTGLTLDASGSIQSLDRDAWLDRREKIKQQGGPPVTDAGR